MKRWIVVLLFMTLPAGYAFAGDHGRGRHEWKAERAREHRIAERRAERRELRHERWERHHRADHRPPGWDHGKKTGWRGGNVPPGQAKKHHRYGRYAHHDPRPAHEVRPPMRRSLPPAAQHDLEQHRAAEHARVQPVAR